jgi:hypothetical protein
MIQVSPEGTAEYESKLNDLHYSLNKVKEENEQLKKRKV